jgi:hypothetical protein
MPEPELRMKDIPLLDSDREALRLEFEDFDEMTLSEFQTAKRKRLDEILDLMNRLKPPNQPE